MATTINKKINHIYILLERLAKGEELYAQDEELLDQLDVSERTLDRYLKDIYELYDKIVLTEKKKKEFTERKVTIYRVTDRQKDVSKILKFFIENSNDLGWVLQMIHENDPSFLKELDEGDRYDIEQNIKEDEGVFVFKSTPFESLDDPAHQSIFSQLKKAVKNHEYRTIVYQKNKMEELKEEMESFKEKAKEQVHDIDMVYLTNQLKLSHIDFKDENFAKLGNGTTWTVKTHHECKLGHWIDEQEKEGKAFTTTSNWSQLKEVHKNVHASVQSYVNESGANSSNELLSRISETLENDIREVFFSLNQTKIDNKNLTHVSDYHPSKPPVEMNVPPKVANKIITGTSTNEEWESF